MVSTGHLQAVYRSLLSLHIVWCLFLEKIAVYARLRPSTSVYREHEVYPFFLETGRLRSSMSVYKGIQGM